MGVSAYYQAIPEESRLFHRLQTEKPFGSVLFLIVFFHVALEFSIFSHGTKRK